MSREATRPRPRDERGPSAENPYQHAIRCFGGKWKMTIIREMAHGGRIRFNRARKVLGISEKVFSQQMSDLIGEGIARREVDDSVTPPLISYALTESGERLVPILDAVFVWSGRDLHEKGIPLDPNALVVHEEGRYAEALGDLPREAIPDAPAADGSGRDPRL